MQLLKIRERVRVALASLADSGTEITPGYFLGSSEYEPMAELLVVIGGCKYSVQICEAGDDE
jgi:hypothetical protein